MKCFALATAMLLATAAAGPAVAEVIYENNFDAENDGETALDYNNIAGLTVVVGSFDLIQPGNGFGITCAGGGGGCLDLDGTIDPPFAGLAFGLADFAFNAGDIVTLNYSVSGSQRSGFGTDGYSIGFEFNQATSGSFTFATSGGGTETLSFIDAGGVRDADNGIPFDRGFVDVTAIFRPTTSGSGFLAISGFSRGLGDSNDDNVGVLLDNLSVSVAAVPEPATWAMMLAGFGMVGSMMRRSGSIGARLRYV